MKKILLVLFFSISALATTHDITNVYVNSDGKTVNVNVAAMDSNGTFRFNMVGHHVPTDSTSSIIVSRKALNTAMAPSYIYDTCFIDTVHCRLYNNSAADSALRYGSVDSTVMTLVLSQDIYAYDTIKSVHIHKGLYTISTTDSSNTYNASSGTNQSLQMYPQTNGMWLSVDRLTVSSAVNVRMKGSHISARNKQSIRAVKFWATDQHGNTVTVFTTSPSVYPYENGVLYGDAYYGSIPTTAFTDGDTVQVHFQAWGWFGDSATVINTNDGVNTNPTPYYAKLIFQLDKAGAYPAHFAVVDSTSGNNSTGVVVDSATGNPDTAHAYQQMGSALNAIAAHNNSAHSHNDVGRGYIYLKDSVNNIYGNNVTATTEPNTWATVKPFPGRTRKQTVVHNKSGSGDPDMLHLENITIDSSVTALITGLKYLWVDRCSVNQSGTGSFYVNSYVWYTGNVFKRLDNIPQGTTNSVPMLWSGNKFALTNSVNCSFYKFCGNLLTTPTAPVSLRAFYTGQTIPTAFDNSFLCDNKLSTNTSICSSPYIGNDSLKDIIHGVVIANNLFEGKNSVVFNIGADVSRSDTVKHVQIYNTTMVGASASKVGRLNGFYNDPAVNNGAVVKKRKLSPIVNSNFTSINIVGNGDTHNGGPYALSGNLDKKYGVDNTGNCYGGFTYKPYYCGIRSNDTANAANALAIGFRADSTATTAGIGDYRLLGTSRALGLPRTLPLHWDLRGATRYIGGAPGPYEYAIPAIDSVSDNSVSVGDTITAYGRDFLWSGLRAKLTTDSMQVLSQTDTTARIVILAASPGKYAFVTLNTDSLLDTLLTDSITVLSNASTSSWWKYIRFRKGFGWGW